MIGDGMGFNHIDAARLHGCGLSRRDVYGGFPVRLAVSTYPAGADYDPRLAWKDLAYVRADPTDSAAAATALSTGVKTRNGALGVDALGRRLETVLERAEALGKSTGLVTTVPFSHATPAGFVVHSPDRDAYETIGREMILASAVDVILGAGHPLFDDAGRPAGAPDYRYVGGAESWERLLAGSAGADADGDGVADPWKLVETREEIRRLGSGPAPKRLLGVARVRSTLQQARPGDARAAPFAVARNEGVPTLPEMARAALNALDDDPDGFFLMIEGGAIDWASHANQSGRMIEEQCDFDRTVEAVAEWMEKSTGGSRTLLIVTSDHETGQLMGPSASAKRAWPPLVDNGPGHVPAMVWHRGDHTNGLVPLYARGEGSGALVRLADRHDPVRGPYLDNTDIGNALREALGPPQTR